MTDRECMEDILASWHERRAMGIDTDADELLKAHPELADELRSSLDTLSILDRAFSAPGVAAGGPPQSIGPYRILHEIGRGGMGVVYEAEQLSMERRVALKVLSPSITNVARSIQRFKLEARAAGQLHHTNIVPVYDMGQHAGFWFYAMELVEGRPLNQILDDLRWGGERAKNSQARISGTTTSTERSTKPHGSRNGHGSSDGQKWYRRIASMFAGVAEALELTHSVGIVHRDIKPANLLLDIDGSLKIVDFGLAHLDGNGPNMTRSGEVLGTPAYMSPEQAVARVQVDHRTDVYSLGATLYEVLTLRSPFDGENLVQLCSQIATVDPVPPRTVDRSIPRDLETIVTKAMEKDRAKRYQQIGDLALDLRAFCEGGAIRARRIGVAGRMWRRVKRHRVQSSLAAAMLVMAVGGGVLAWQLANAERNAVYEELIARGQEANAATFANAQGVETVAQLDAEEMSWEIFSEAIALDPDRPAAYWLRALSPGDIDARVRDIDAALVRGLAPGTAHWLRAYLFTLKRRHSEARKECDLAKSCADPDTPETAYAQARFVALSGQRKDALGLLTKAIDGSEQVRIVRYLALRERATLYRQAGRLEDALRDLLAIQSLGDRRVSVQIQIASLWKDLGRTETAEAMLSEVLETVRHSGNIIDWRTLLHTCKNVGELAWADQASHECIVACRALIELDSTLAGTHRTLGDALAMTGQLDAAIAAFRDALDLQPDHPSAYTYNNLGNAYAKKKQFGAAIDAYREAIKQRPILSTAHLNLGQAFYMKGQYPAAIDAIQTAIQLQPDYAKAYYELGRVLSKSGKEDKSIEALQKAVELNPNHADFLSRLAGPLAKKGRYDDAIRLLHRAIDVAPDHAFTYYRLGLVQKGIGKIEQAESAYNEAIRLNPEFAKAHTNLGYIMYLNGEFDDAIESFRTAIRHKSDLVQAHYGLSLALFKDGQLDDAIESIRTAIWLEPDSSSSHMALGAFLAEQGKLSESTTSYHKVIDLTPDYPHAYCNLGSALLREGKLDEAAASFRHALDRMPDHADAYYKLGLVLVQKGKLDEAAASFRHAVDRKPDYANAYYNLACLDALLRHKDEALGWLSKAAQAGYSDTAHMEQDTDMDNLRDDALYAEIVASMRSKENR